MEKLICAVQTYDWGRQGSQSEVAILMHAANKQFVIDETKPYAEVYLNFMHLMYRLTFCLIELSNT